MSNVTATTFTLLGGQFQIGDGGSPTETFTTISQVETCDFSGGKVVTNKVTSADNVDGVERFADTLFDPGECTFTIFWNPNDATHQQLWNSFIARGPHNFKRISAGGFGTRSFTGIIESLDIKGVLDKPTMATGKIKVSGPFTSSVAGA